MILSDRDILDAVKSNSWLAITPFDPKRVQPASYDVALSNKFRVFERGNNTFIDPTRKQENLSRYVEVPEGEKFILHPGEFVLGMTQEIVELGAMLAGRIEGKSSLGRLGIVIHSTAGWLDPGFRGTITLELSNATPLAIILTPGMLIGQVAFMMLYRQPIRLYGDPDLGSKYQGHLEPTESRYHQT